MRAKLITAAALVLLIGSTAFVGGQPLIQSFDPGAGLLTWTNPIPGNLSIIEHSTNLLTGRWVPLFYDWGTVGLLTTRIPTVTSAQSFYRIGVQTNIPDPSLVMDLSFDNAFSNGTVLDISGHGNHGLRYGRPGYPTNWPSAVQGPDGSQAAEFHWYEDGFGIYGKSGDYIGIPISPSLTNLAQATISVWVRYYASVNNDINYDHNSSIFDTGKDVPGTWNLGRAYSDYTAFSVWTGNASEVQVLNFPDVSPTGESGGWHQYSITFSNGIVNGYFDGVFFGAATVPVSALTVAGYYIGMACWTFNETPQMDLTVDEHPNNAWINGAVDDPRIYNRALSASEVLALYQSYDRLSPTVPSNLIATVPSSSQVELRWSPSSNTFGVSGYILRRNGSVIATTTATVWFDGNLSPQSSNSYTVQAFDPQGNYSSESPAVVATTLPAGSSVNLIIDDADGLPWFLQDSGWIGVTNNNSIPGYWASSYVSDGKTGKGKGLTYRPPIPEDGNYNVFMRYPGSSSTAFVMETAVPVDIVHNGATNTVMVNEQVNYGAWKLLGQFTLSAGTNDFVRLRTDGTSGYVFGDAFMFVK